MALGILTPTDPDPGPGPEGEFEPDAAMTRGAVAAPLVKLAELLGRQCPAGATNPFSDVTGSAARSVGCLHALGITAYEPDQSLTRAQAAGMLIRLWRSLGRECPPSATMPFTDVNTASAPADDIACLHALGITIATGAATYEPDRPVTRAQFATLAISLYDAAQPPEDTDDTDRQN